MTAQDIESAPYCLFKIGRFGTGAKHVGKLVGVKVIPVCRMFGGSGRAMVGQGGKKPLHAIPGGKIEEATCEWCKPTK